MDSGCIAELLDKNINFEEKRKIARGPRGGGVVLDFGLDGGVPPGPRDPNPCLEVKKVFMFRDFAQKMDPCLGIFDNFREPRKFL